MIFRFLYKLGIPSDAFYVASLGSIAASIIAWAVRSGKDVGNAERLGIFIGLWAPTFMLVGHGVHELEVAKGFQSKTLGDIADRVEATGERVRSTAESAVGR
jgi:hypothetical protein